MMQRFGLWPVVIVLVFAFGLTAWAASEKNKPSQVQICEPAPASAAADAAPLPAGMDPNAAYTAHYPWNSAADGVQKTASGLEYIVLTKGPETGAHPTATDQVEVQYDGRLAATGAKFDATEGAQTVKFGVGEVIPGWTEMLQLMRPGDQVIVKIPAALGYGARAQADRIPANSDLLFVVTLKGIVHVKAPYEACWLRVMSWPRAGATRLPSGVQYFSVASGPATESPPGDGDMVSLYIDARLADGSPLGSNFGAEQPLTGPVNDIGPGLGEVLKLMRPGDHWFARIPRNVAFASQQLKPDGPLLLEIMMEGVMRMPAMPAGGPPGMPPGMSLPPEAFGPGGPPGGPPEGPPAPATSAAPH
jgi:FKBP-type peptidyl-prolyl cis-trans isomerase